MKRKTDRVKMILVVFLVLLGATGPAVFTNRTVHAQSTPPRYQVVVITPDLGDSQKGFEAALNAAAKGRELVSVIPSDRPRQYLAVYKE